MAKHLLLVDDQEERGQGLEVRNKAKRTVWFGNASSEVGEVIVVCTAGTHLKTERVKEKRLGTSDRKRIG